MERASALGVEVLEAGAVEVGSWVATRAVVVVLQVVVVNLVRVARAAVVASSLQAVLVAMEGTAAAWWEAVRLVDHQVAEAMEVVDSAVALKEERAGVEAAAEGG